MVFKKMESNLTFTDLSLLSSIEKNRAIQRMEQINAIIDWSHIETLIVAHYPVGKSAEGNDARKRLAKDTMRLINNDLLSQFADKGLTINEGIAIDARLVRSASHPISTETLNEERGKRQKPEGKLNKKGKACKFSRDCESDWTVKNDTPHYGMKEHASVDTRYGFVLATEITPASHHDSPYLPLCVAGSCHTKEPIKKVSADKGYFGEPNRAFLALNRIEDGIMRKDTTAATLTDYEKERNKLISKKRYIVEQYFGLSHLHNNAFRARFPRLITNAMDVLIRQMAFNLLRGVRVVPA